MQPVCFRCSTLNGQPTPSTVDVVNTQGEVVMALCEQCLPLMPMSPGYRVQDRLFPEMAGARRAKSKVTCITEGQAKRKKKPAISLELASKITQAYRNGAQLGCDEFVKEIAQYHSGMNLEMQLVLSNIIFSASRRINEIVVQEVELWNKLIQAM